MKNTINRIVVWVIVMSLLICSAQAGSVFPDVDDNADYAEAVKVLNNMGIMVGDDQGNFNPSKTITRAEMAAIVCRMLGCTDGLTNSDVFSDVPINHWANAYIGRASEFGIVSGYGNGQFGPSDIVTYDQAVTMIVRAVGGESEALDMGGYPEGYLSVATKYNLLNGVLTEKDHFMSRANIAIIINNCIN